MVRSYDPVLNDQLTARFCSPSESWGELVRRVASLSNSDVRAVFEAITEARFIPGGQVLRGAGKSNSVLFNSYVAAPEPDESLQDLSRRITSWTRKGCGVGLNVTSLTRRRPNTSLSEVIESIGRSQQCLWDEGIRRTATMVNIDFGVAHIAEASRMISAASVLRHLNIAVMLPDLVLTAAARPEGSRERAELQRLADAVWTCGNPGFVFVDRVNRDHPFVDETIHACNSCAEQFLLPNEGAPLGSINLAAFVDSGTFDFRSLGEVTKTSVRFLNDVIDATSFPSAEAQTICERRRRIGLGVMGYDTALHSLGIPYGSDDAIALTREIGIHLANQASGESRTLGSVHGSFSDVAASSHAAPRRNSNLLSIAPTGGISSLLGVSSGIEPLFGAHLRKEEATVVMNLANSSREAVPPESIHWRSHLRTLVAWQDRIDGGISKTINVPETTSKSTILEIILEGWRLGAKSVSIFRKGCRPAGVQAI